MAKIDSGKCREGAKFLFRKMLLIFMLIFSFVVFGLFVIFKTLKDSYLSISFPPVNLLVILTTAFSLWMLARFFKPYKKELGIKAIVLIIILACSVTFSIFGNDNPVGGIQFNTVNSLFVMTAVGILSVFIFNWNNKRNPMLNRSTGSTKRDSIYFATGIMWLSPFIGELLIWLCWYLKGTAYFSTQTSGLQIGGFGLSDGLFLFGFATFISMAVYYFIDFLATVINQKIQKTK